MKKISVCLLSVFLSSSVFSGEKKRGFPVWAQAALVAAANFGASAYCHQRALHYERERRQADSRWDSTPEPQRDPLFWERNHYSQQAQAHRRYAYNFQLIGITFTAIPFVEAAFFKGEDSK